MAHNSSHERKYLFAVLLFKQRCIQLYFGGRNAPIQGFTFYDGPVWGENLWFNGFVSTDLYKAGAIGYERFNEFSSCSASAVRNAKFGFVDGVSDVKHRTK